MDCALAGTKALMPQACCGAVSRGISIGASTMDETMDEASTGGGWRHARANAEYDDRLQKGAPSFGVGQAPSLSLRGYPA